MVAAGVTWQSLIKPCLLLLAGGVAAQHSTLLLASDVLCLALVSSLAALSIRRMRAAACLVAGFALFQLAGTAIIEARLDPLYAGDSMLAIVRVTGFPREDGDSISLSVAPLADKRIPGRVRLSWFQPPVTPRIGDVWELELRLRPPRGSLNPGGFDRESWLFREKFHATGYVVPGKRNRLLWSGTASAVDRFRSGFVDYARGEVGRGETSAVLAAIAVGARQHMTRAQWDRYAATGTSHLMAISGLHVGLAALVGFVVIFGLGLLIPMQGNRYAAAIVAGVVLATAYALVSGFGVPSRRAVLMLALGAITLACRRQVSSGQILAVVAGAVFVTDPIASMTPGFHLSFAAVVALVWLAHRGPGSGRRRCVALRRLVEMQVFLTFGLLPLTALLFQRFALVATPVNLVAVPVFSLVTVPLTLAGMALAESWEWAAAGALRLAAASVDLVSRLIEIAARPAFARDTLAEFSGAALLLLILPLAWVVLPRGWPGRYIAVVGAALIVAWKPPGPPAACFDAWTLDVGQGLAVAIRTGQGVTVYDTGMAWRSGTSAAEQVIAPFLASRGVSRITRLVISHADLDHSGGLPYLRERHSPTQVIAGEPVSGTAAWLCAAGQRWWEGAVHFEILYPAVAGTREGNDASCVLRVSAGPYAMLLTGDVEVRAERELLLRGERLGADIVVVPHHGSLTSSSVPFVDATSPSVAVVSAAYANRWGFPRPPVVARWQAVGAEVLNTGRDGAVSSRICADRGVVSLTTEREKRRRFWHTAD